MALNNGTIPRNRADIKAALKDEIQQVAMSGVQAQVIPAIKSLPTTAYDLLKTFHSPRKWFIKDILPAGLMSGLAAESGTGKTWLALDMSICIASGTLWAGVHETKKSVVGYIDLEGDSRDVFERLLLLLAGRLPDNERPTRELIRRMIECNDEGDFEMMANRLYKTSAVSGALQNFHIWPGVGAVNILSHETYEMIAAWVKENHIELLILDTYKRLHQLDENSNSDMSTVNAVIDKLARDTGATPLPVLHTGHSDKGRARGASEIFAAMQHQLLMEKVDADTALLKLTKAKRGREGYAAKVTRLTTLPTGIKLEYDFSAEATKPPQKHSKSSGKTAEQWTAITGAMGTESYRHSDLVTLAMSVCEIAETWAKKRVKELVDTKRVTKSEDGTYCVLQPRKGSGSL